MTIEEALKLPVRAIIQADDEHILVVRMPNEANEETIEEAHEMLEDVLPSDVRLIITNYDFDVDSLEMDEAKDLLRELREVIEEDDE